MQRYELDAWLGDSHGLTEDQVATLLAVADDIAAAYPAADSRADATHALIGACRAMVDDPETVAADLGDALLKARIAEAEAKAELRGAALALVHRSDMAEAEFGRLANVSRATVRSWIGK